MKIIGPYNFGVSVGERIRVKISLATELYVQAILDGINIEPHDTGEAGTLYSFKVERPPGESHVFAISLAKPSLVEEKVFEIEVFGKEGESAHLITVNPKGEPSISRVLTFSTHGGGGGSKD